MMTVYDLNDKGEIVNAILEHMAQQIENPALTLFQLGGGWNPPPPGFSLAIATKINQLTPNFLTFNFYYRDII